MPVPPDRPDDEADVDREIRIEKMKRELDEIADGKMFSGSFGPVSPEMEEAFLEQVLAYERAEFDTNFDRLIHRRIALPLATELDDAELSAKLAEVIRELVELRCFLQDTDHLSDRELYDWLWSSGLREDTPDISGMPDGAWHTSPIGGGSDGLDAAQHPKIICLHDGPELCQVELFDGACPLDSSVVDQDIEGTIGPFNCAARQSLAHPFRIYELGSKHILKPQSFFFSKTTICGGVLLFQP